MDWPDYLRGTKQPGIGSLPSRLMIMPSKTRCLSWRPCVKKSLIISKTISQAGNWSHTSPVDCEGRAITGKNDQRRMKSWFRKSAQDDKWNFCLTTAMIAVNRSDHEQTTPPEPLAGLQGEGGPGRHQGRPNDRPAGRAFRRPPQPDHGMEIAA